MRRRPVSPWICRALVLTASATCAAQPTTPSDPPVPVGYGPVAPARTEQLPIGRQDAVVRPPTRSDDAAPLAPLSPPSRASGRKGVLWPLAGVLGLLVIGSAAVRIIARRSGTLGASLGAGGRSPAGVLEILGRYPVGRGAMLVLLKLDRRVLLLSQSAGGRLGAGAGFTTLCEISDPEEVASILVKARDAEGDSMAERFRSLLTRFDTDFSRAEASPAATSRRRQVAAAGDRTELWDERRADIPIVDLTQGPSGSGAVSTLRDRIRTMTGRGAA